jgi:hypothetical protein
MALSFTPAKRRGGGFNVFLKTFRVFSENESPEAADLMVGATPLDGEMVLSVGFYQTVTQRVLGIGMMNTQEAEMLVEALKTVIATAKQANAETQQPAEARHVH